MANHPNRSLAAAPRRTLHLVEAGQRQKGTWSNPVVETPPRNQLHERRMSPARMLAELLHGDRDWPLWELRDSTGDWWPLSTTKERRIAMRMIVEATDLRSGWNEESRSQWREWHHPAFAAVGEPLQVAYRYHRAWEHIRAHALTEAAALDAAAP